MPGKHSGNKQPIDMAIWVPGKRGRKPLDMKLRKAKAIRFFKQRMEGKTKLEIAKAEGTSHQTVQKWLTWGERAGIFAQFEDQLFQKLLPAAEQALLEAMQDGDAQVALEVYKGANILRNSKERAQQVDSQNSDDPLLSYVKSLRDQEEDDDELIDGEVVGARPQLTDGRGLADQTVGAESVQEVGGRTVELAAWEEIASVGQKGNGENHSKEPVAAIQHEQPAGEGTVEGKIQSGVAGSAEKVTGETLNER